MANDVYKLSVGQKFNDFEMFRNYLEQYSRRTKQIFYVSSARTVEQYNKHRTKKLDVKLKYAYVKYTCKCGGKERRRGAGIRSVQRSNKQGCPASIYLSGIAEPGILVVQTANLRHACTVEEHYDTYPEVISAKKCEFFANAPQRQSMDLAQYTTSLVKTLYDFQQTGILCDIVIQLNDCQLTAHSVVLAAASPKLKTMITGMNDVDSKDPVLKIVDLEGYTANDAKLLLEYMYTGKIAKPESAKQLDNVMSLFDALEMTRPTLVFEEENSYPQPQNISGSELIAESLTDNYNEIPTVQGGLEEQTQRHTMEHPTSLNTCGQLLAATAKSSLRRHLSKPKDSAQCHLCGRHFSSKSYLQVHIDMHCNKRERCHMCDKCDRLFFDRNSLRKHSTIHDAVRRRPFVCSICDSTFFRKSNLLSHNRSHQNDRPFECIVCRKSFKFKMHYRRHLKIHEKHENQSLV